MDVGRRDDRDLTTMLSSGPTHGFWLWYATLAGIVLWMVHLVGLSSLADLTCSWHGTVWVMHALTIVLAAATCVAGLLSFALVRARTGHREDEPDLDGRLRFMGLFGVLTSGISLVLIVWEGAYVPFVDGCR